ncbi:MAG: DUF2067 domain-containing protein [Caldisphaeraceae archaeon]|nr:DUF2067 domain-containing protein [Caldisphaeraceae archaeon]
MRKVIRINLKDNYNVEELVENINKVISSEEAMIRVEGSSLTISFINPNRKVNNIRAKIKEFLKSYKPPRKRTIYNEFKLSNLLEHSKWNNYEVLTFILTKKGYEAYIDNEKIVTNASKEILEKTINDINDAIKLLKDVELSSAARKSLLCVLTLKKTDVLHLIGVATSLNVLVKNKRNKLYTTHSWKETCEMLNKVV